jgi:hypothetical protein
VKALHLLICICIISGQAQISAASELRRGAYNELGHSGSNNNFNELPLSRKPQDPVLNSLISGRYDSAIDRVSVQYACKPLSSDPTKRAQALIQKFDSPRSEEARKYQAFCWESADKTIKDLAGQDDALANTLKLKVKTNRESVKTQAAIDSCPGTDSEFRRRLRQQLELAQPFEDIFRSVPIKIPPQVSEQDSLRELRKAIYSESLTQAAERSIVLAKTHGLGHSKIIDKICPSDSICAKETSPRDLKAYLQSRYENLKNADIPQKSDAEVYSSLQSSVRRIDQEAKKFNSQLTCHEVGSAVTGSSRICNSASAYTKFSACPESACSNPEKKSADMTSDKRAGQLNKEYYSAVDEILGSDQGSLLAHEPYKSQLKTLYGGIPVKMNGETSYVFFKKHNEPPGFDSLSDKTAWKELPENRRLVGGPQTVHEAALNALDNTAKYASALNKIENSIRKGNDPDYGIFSMGDPEKAGLALISRLNPYATARVLLSNPQIARTGAICSMIEAGEQFEKNKETEGLIQSILGLGAIAVGAAATLLPTGITQVVGPALALTGTGLAAGGTAISTKNAYDNYNLSSRTGYAYSATKNVDLKYDSEKANSEMVTSAAQVVGDAAGAALLKSLSSGASAKRAIINQQILQEAARAKRAGQSIFDDVKNAEALGSVLGKLSGPEELVALRAAAKKDPVKWKQLVNRLNRVCGATARNGVIQNPQLLYSKYLFLITIFESAALAADFGCSLEELNTLTIELRRFAGFDSATLRPGSLVTIERSDGTISNAEVTGFWGNGEVAVEWTENGKRMGKTVPDYTLGNGFEGYGFGKLPKESYRSQPSGTRVSYKSLRGNQYDGYYVAETDEFIFYKERINGEVTGLRKERISGYANENPHANKGHSGGGGNSNNSDRAHNDFSAGDNVSFSRSSGAKSEGRIVLMNPDGTATVEFIDESGRTAYKTVPLEDLGKGTGQQGSGGAGSNNPPKDNAHAKRPESPGGGQKAQENAFPQRSQTPE